MDPVIKSEVIVYEHRGTLTLIWSVNPRSQAHPNAPHFSNLKELFDYITNYQKGKFFPLPERTK